MKGTLRSSRESTWPFRAELPDPRQRSSPAVTVTQTLWERKLAEELSQQTGQESLWGVRVGCPWGGEDTKDVDK